MAALRLRRQWRQALRLRLRPLLRPIVRELLWYRYETHFISGDAQRVRIGRRVGIANTLINVASGNVEIGDYTIFGHNVMLLTGRHEFKGGRRASLTNPGSSGWGGGPEEVPGTGFDIRIGSGCWIASGAIVIGPVTIGDDSIVMGGAVVTKDVPAGAIVSGIPAKVRGYVTDVR